MIFSHGKRKYSYIKRYILEHAFAREVGTQIVRFTKIIVAMFLRAYK